MNAERTSTLRTLASFGLVALIASAGCFGEDATVDGEAGYSDKGAPADESVIAAGAPSFQAPFGCGQTWTFSHHNAEVRRALDFVNTNGATNLQPILASAPGRATRMFQQGGAGQYIMIDHGGGWTTYYFHLSSYSVASGTQVVAGQEVGKVGSTGASSGPHLHYEQLLNGAGQNIVINNSSLSPYPGSYFQRNLKSGNCGDCTVHADGKLYCNNKLTPMRAEPDVNAAVVNTLRTTYSYFSCFKKGGMHVTNTTWYKTVGDDNGNEGWVPAVNVKTTPEFDQDPASRGLAECQ